MRMKVLIGAGLLITAAAAYAVYDAAQLGQDVPAVAGINSSPKLAQVTGDIAKPEELVLAQADFGADVPAELEIQPTDVVLGDADAPVTIVEYASMSCSHCADFHNDIFPQIKQNYIETGKVKFVLRDLPWDNIAMGVSKIARCAPKEQFYPLITAFMRTQSKWIKSMDPLGDLKQVARLAGLDGTAVDRCIKDAALHEQIVASKNTAQKLGVRGTPTFFINGEMLGGVRNYSEIKSILDVALMRVTTAS